ncbi:thioredoxin-like protein [Pilobolus umbonatus]|nr:thioredoxin-like protein [Pilobolus umbonatus]
MSFIKKLFVLLLTINIGLLSYDTYQGGQIVNNLVENVREFDMNKVQYYITHINSLTPEKVANSINSAFAQLQNINSPQDMIDLVREKTSPNKQTSVEDISYEDSVVILTDKNFKRVIDGSKPALIEFYAPWCGHCKKLTPIYSSLAESFGHAKDKVIIAKLDADSNRATGELYGIKGYPTIKWFPAGINSPEQAEDYKGGRTLEAFSGFIQQKTGLSPRGVKKSKVTTLNAYNFNEIVLNSKKNVLVDFYDPNCGHCQKLAPVYKEIADIYSKVPNCLIVDINCDQDKSVCNAQDIAYHPTIKFFPAESKEPIVYEGDRSIADLVEFLNKHCHAERTVDGGLLPHVGRIALLDELVKQFMNHPQSREDIYTKAAEAASTLDNQR